MSGGAPIPQSTGDIILSVDDIEKAGSVKLPELIRDFYNSGSTDQRTLHENVASLNRYRLRSRVLVDVSGLTTKTQCLEREIKFPLGISPAGLQAMAHPSGELATSAACSKSNINMAISSYANHSIEDIVQRGESKVSYAIQLYTMTDRALQERIIRKAEASGCTAIFLTGDSAVLGLRFKETKDDFRIPAQFSLPILERDSEMIQKQTHESGFSSFNDSSHNWERDIKWLRERTKMQIWIKGVMTAEDVELAAKHGCDGVVVSNHGGRQLDGVPATIDALLECAPVAREKGIGVHIDGGFRRGSDIFVALALGAECVWVGRPAIWGLAYNGQAGVEKMIEVLYTDFRRTMALCGCNSVQEINKSCLSRMGMDGILRRVQ